MARRSAANLDTALRNIARGGYSYRLQRLKVFNAIAQHSTQVAAPLSDYLARKLLCIDNYDWINLTLVRGDMPAISKLMRATPQMTET